MGKFAHRQCTSKPLASSPHLSIRLYLSRTSIELMSAFDPFAQISDIPTDSNFVLETYKDPDTHLTVQTILKVFPVHLSCNFQESFMHLTASKISTGVVRYYEASHDQGILKIRMEYCEQGSLMKVMKLRAAAGSLWSLEELLVVYKGLLVTMNELQEQRIAHRCIDCSNIFVTQQGELKLGDFGSSKSVQEGDSVRAHSVRAFRAYVSPQIAAEQEGSEVSVFKEDVWSLGKVFFEMATLKVYKNLNTFPDDKLAEKVTSTLERYGCPGLATLLLKMMSREVTQRPLYSDCLQALERIQGTPEEIIPRAKHVDNLQALARVQVTPSEPVKPPLQPISILPETPEATEAPYGTIRPAEMPISSPFWKTDQPNPYAFRQAETPPTSGVFHLAEKPISSPVRNAEIPSPSSVQPAEIPNITTMRPAQSCCKCNNTKVLPKLYDCLHSICMECLKKRIKQEVRIRCEACGREAALDSIGTDMRISWTIKENILNAFQEACEQRKRALNR